MPSTPSFSQSERPSIVLPGLIAVAVLAAAILIAIRLYPATTVHVSVLKTELLAEKTVMTSDSIVVAPRETNYTLFVVTTIKLENRLRTVASFDDASLTLTDPAGAQLTEKALQKNDLPNATLMFPALKPLLATPLLRDTEMSPGQSTQGTLVFSFAVPQSVWETRKSAYLTVALYHQPTQTIPLPH